MKPPRLERPPRAPEFDAADRLADVIADRVIERLQQRGMVLATAGKPSPNGKETSWGDEQKDQLGSSDPTGTKGKASGTRKRFRSSKEMKSDVDQFIAGLETMKPKRKSG